MTQRILDLDFSRLVVGTAQFGLPYGIANRTGQPSFEEVCRILACAVENGATTLDTAAAYGESEVVLGRALAEIGARDRVLIVSKVRHVKYMEQPRTPENVKARIRTSVTNSLARLRVDSLPVCLFHDAADRQYMDMLLDLKREGLVQHTGVSLGTPAELGKVLGRPGVEAVQVAGNMLDQRALRTGDLARAADASVAVFLRSVYLQGLLVMPEEEIIPELQEVVPVRRALQQIAGDAGLTLPEMALRFGLSMPGVTGVLTGVETAEQMAANADMVARGPLPSDIVVAIQRAVPDLGGSIVLNSTLWPGAMR